MNGVRFYKEYDSEKDKRNDKPNGNVFAAFVCNGIMRSGGKGMYEGVGAVHYYPNSPVAGTAVALDYLKDQCKRISEQEARKIHPEMFRYLDTPLP